MLCLISILHNFWQGDLKTAAPWMIEDTGTHASYEDICKKVMAEIKMPKLLFKMGIYRSNRYINKVRKK